MAITVVSALSPSVIAAHRRPVVTIMISAGARITSRISPGGGAALQERSRRHLVLLTGGGCSAKVPTASGRFDRGS
jgi:hypothetical protein